MSTLTLVTATREIAAPRHIPLRTRPFITRDSLAEADSRVRGGRRAIVGVDRFDLTGPLFYALRDKVRCNESRGGNQLYLRRTRPSVISYCSRAHTILELADDLPPPIAHALSQPTHTGTEHHSCRPSTQ